VQGTLSGADETIGGDLLGTTASGTGTLTPGSEGLDSMQLAPGQRVGPYLLERHIGSGGMGEVYRARNVESDKNIAIKFMSRTTARLLYRFKREFRALAGVSHRNLIGLGELVVPNSGAPFFTMEFVDGVGFVEYVRRRARPGELPNLVRLGRALRQLVHGLAYLHEVGCVHRDVKPSNVLVTHEGRVVILDFGLVSEVGRDDDSGISRDGQMLGTPAYMAPEQAGLEVTPASDFYAVGVMLFECLTGALPFRGSALDMLLRKQEQEPPDPATLVAGVPNSLRELCRRLLSPEPERRPSVDEVLAALSSPTLGTDESGEVPAPSVARDLRSRVPFIGRHAELQQLSDALDDVRSRQTAVTVLVGGASGLGKTAMVERYLAEVRATSESMILRGRCLERESVPYKGIDAIVDALSARLRRMHDNELAALRPRHAAALMQIFPVLDDLWSVDRGELARYEPSELRRLGTMALREILTRIAHQRPLILHVDDFQWSDVDGARLLTALVRPPEPPVLLLLLSFRGTLAEAIASSEAMREIDAGEARLGRDIRELELGPLSDAAATELAAAMMGLDLEGTIDQREASHRDAEAVARRAGGNPFYIGQLVAGDLAGSSGISSETGDDRLVARRVLALEPDARRILATVAVSGGPTPLTLLRTIRSQQGQDPSLGPALEQLCRLGLLTRRGGEFDSNHDEASASTVSGVADVSDVSAELRAQGGVVLEAAHARIREVTIAELDTAELAEIHREIARALEQLDGDPDALAEHFESAGEFAPALDYAEQAAQQAISALAFGRAVTLFRRAIALLGELEAQGRAPDAARRFRLRLALAEQLVNFGRSSEAGRLLRELADQATDPVLVLRLRRDAAAQLLEAGHVSEGLALSAVVLHAVGESPPRGFWASLWHFLFGRLRRRIGGLGYTERPASALPADRLELFDTLFLINRGLTLHLEMHSFVLHNRLLGLALELGEPRRLAMMLANEMLVVASSEGEGRVHGIAGEARDLAARSGDVEVDRMIDMQSCMVDYALNRFKLSTDRLRELLKRLDDVAGAEWLRLMATLVYSSLCVITGRWAELYRNLPQWLAAARERGNLREIVELDAYAAMTELHRGNLEQARYHLESSRALWDASSYNYTSVMIDRVEILMLLGEGQHARVVTRVDEMLAAVKRSSVAINPVVQRFVDQLIGRCWAAAAVHAPGDTKLHARLRKVCKRLRKTKVSLYVGEAALFEAALASVAGDGMEQRRRWREAELLFGEAGIETQLAAVRWQLAQVTSDEESRKFSRAATKYFGQNGISNVASLSALLVPCVAPPALPPA
jgi:serine/threonine protein kinase